MEKIFRMADCTEEEKIIFATNQFRGAAEDWWETAQRRMRTSGMEMNWNNFKKVMSEKYLSGTYKVRKEQEYLQLKHGNMSVTEFTRKFEELSHYSTHNEYAGNEMWKVNQYKHALRGEIYAVVSQQRLTNFDEMVHNSLEGERGFDKDVKEGTTAFDRRRGNFTDRHHEKLKPKGSPQKGKQSGSFKTFPTCKRCGKAHTGECKLGDNSCYACGQT
jgi:hypothetical protein